MMMVNPKIYRLLILLCFLHHFIPTQGKTLLELNNVTTLHHNATNSSTLSPFLKGNESPRFFGCWNRPWICNQDFFPRIRMICCRNRCVDVTSDPNNCGLCGIRCPFTWQCCRGLCVNTRFNPFHCGRCDHRCPFLSFCSYGMCGYAQPLPPFPFPPFPPKPPHPPKPFPPHPPKPFPPHPPKPFLPHPPKPFPPHPFPPHLPKPFPPGDKKPHPPASE